MFQGKNKSDPLDWDRKGKGEGRLGGESEYMNLEGFKRKPAGMRGKLSQFVFSGERSKSKKSNGS